MAGVMMSGDEGVEVKRQTVPTMNGLPYDEPGHAEVVASAHLTDGPRAEGVDYPETQGIAVTNEAYPAGTTNAGDSTTRARV